MGVCFVCYMLTRTTRDKMDLYLHSQNSFFESKRDEITFFFNSKIVIHHQDQDHHQHQIPRRCCFSNSHQ